MSEEKNAPEEKMTFEEALAALEDAAEKLRSGRLGLEESIDVYDKSIMYYKQCEKILKDARQKIMIFDPVTGETKEFE